MNAATHQEKEKNKKTGKRKAEDRLILKRLCATLLQSFRVLHSKKWFV